MPKTILLLSPQRWGTMFLSKHHYAVELARRGHRVYFVDPPLTGGGVRSHVELRPLSEAPGLWLVAHRVWFPEFLRFHVPAVHAALMRRHLRTLLAALPGAPDEIWSFDQNGLYPLDLFPAGPRRIFFPVDAPRSPAAFHAARGAEVLFTVAAEIAAQYAPLGIPAHCIGHGVSDLFLHSTPGVRPAGDAVRVGLSGNFTRTFIDFPVLLAIVRAYPAVVFECWGSYRADDSNIGGGSDRAVAPFITQLRECPNVVLHGPVATAVLAGELSRMDAFLICYDVPNDQSSGTNYHKVLEYLAAGRVVVSSHITAYAGRPELVEMVASRTDNGELPALFGRVIGNLAHFNATERQETRRNFARTNTYSRKIEQIEAATGSDHRTAQPQDPC